MVFKSICQTSQTQRLFDGGKNLRKIDVFIMGGSHARKFDTRVGFIRFFRKCENFPDFIFTLILFKALLFLRSKIRLNFYEILERSM